MPELRISDIPAAVPGQSRRVEVTRQDGPARRVAVAEFGGGADGRDGALVRWYLEDYAEGLDLDVLRPATFARLSRVLHAAKAAGQPYHVVHFDGHGTYLDVAGMSGGGVGLSPLLYGVSVAGSVRPGQHGYLLFEDSGNADNQQLVDRPVLGRLLMETDVPVLVLNACRSAYTEARSQPADGESQPGDDELSGDVHARIRAYGSLAAEVADAGVPGVVAMRYNVYVVTAAQYMADLTRTAAALSV